MKSHHAEVKARLRVFDSVRRLSGQKDLAPLSYLDERAVGAFITALSAVQLALQAPKHDPDDVTQALERAQRDIRKILKDTGND